MKRCVQVDDFFSDPGTERRRAVDAEYIDQEHLGIVYPGIALAPDPVSEDRIRQMLGVTGGTFTTFYRRYLPNLQHPTFIHNDCQIGTYSAIAFLMPRELAKGGVAFWRHRVYGWESQPSRQDVERLGLEDTPAFWEQIHREGFDEKRWEMVDYVPVWWNRLVLFRSDRYHSRYPLPLPGTSPDDCRTIKTFFWKADEVTP